MKKIIFLTALWLSSLTTIFILTFALALYSPAKSQVLGTEIYLGSHETETFSSVPEKVGQIESETQFEEAKNQIIRNYLIKYKAPEELLNEVDFIVEKSLEKEIGQIGRRLIFKQLRRAWNIWQNGNLFFFNS